VLPHGASVKDTLGYVPHAAHPALDAAMRELHASMHTNRPRSSMVRDTHTVARHAGTAGADVLPSHTDRD